MEGSKLLKIARNAITSKFKRTERLNDSELTQRMGCFVTLTKQGELRGCRGYITSDEPLGETLRKAAISAAFNDPRFPPLKEEELSQIKIEISILSQPKPIKVQDPIKRLQKFVPGTTGVIIQKGMRLGLLLPQVFDKDTTAEEAYSMTSQKAGLPRDSWKEPDTRIYLFTAEIYSE